MFWNSLFLISIAQGLFLSSLILFKKSRNYIASVIIVVLLIAMVFTNLGYLVIRTPLVNYAPQLFAVPFGMIFLFGPLFYFYSRSVVDAGFKWKRIYWLHFLPYFLQLVLNIPLIMAPREFWVQFSNTFFTGNLPIQLSDKIIFAIQDIHLFIYLLITFRWLKRVKSMYGNVQYIISISLRAKWLRELGFCLSFFLFTVIGLYIFVLVNGKYNPVANYSYTVVTSAIIYFLAYRIVLKPELILLDFSKKYKAYKAFNNSEGDEYVQKIDFLLTEKKIFENPGLKLADMADELKLPSHQLSKLINEKFGKSFSDLINEYRVKAFIEKINHPDFQNHSILGIAFEVGFNTKSSFNSNFKKVTGKNPSDYKTA